MINKRWLQHNLQWEVYNMKQMNKILNCYRKLKKLVNNYMVSLKNNNKNGNIYQRWILKERKFY
jgi:hypothetical protein